MSNNISVERDFLGTLHIKVGDFDYVQIQYQHPYTDNASTKALADRIVAILAQPAEAEGVGHDTIVCWNCETIVSLEDHADADGACPVCMAELDLSDYLFNANAALSAVTAERDRLREQCDLNDMVHGTKGRERVAALLSQIEAFRKDAERLDWLDGYIVIAEHEDTGKLAFNSIKGALRECIDAAMAAKEE